MTRAITLVCAAVLGAAIAGAESWLRAPSPPAHVEAESIQVSRRSPLRLPDCEPCAGLADDEATCEVAYQGTATAKKEELLAEHWPNAHRVEWPAAVAPSEEPEAVIERIDAFADRCLRPGAPLSIRCDEYPCAFAYRKADVTGEGCDEPWSTLDYSRNASVNRDHTNKFRFAVDPDAPEEIMEKVSQRSRRRGGVLARDVISGEVRVMPIK